MTDRTQDTAETVTSEPRRDFLLVATGAVATVGLVVASWPLIDSMNPAADVMAIRSIDVDLSPVAVGQRITVSWRGQPVFVDHRSAERIAAAEADDQADLIDPQSDKDRTLDAEWLIVVGICTHLGCVPLGQNRGDPVGRWGGWFCPCHGSQYDTSGRVRRGPAPRNLVVPPYKFTDDLVLLIG